MAQTVIVEAHARVAEIGRAAWDACARNPAYNDNPFVCFDFLDATEESGCAVERTGWAPRHLAARGEDGEVAGVMPLYLKSHSRGEYVFDWSWADAYERAGGRYYPKLLSAARSPPATGPRLMAREGCDADATRRMLLAGAPEALRADRRLGRQRHLPHRGGVAVPGPAGPAAAPGPAVPLAEPGYRDFEDYLSALSSNRRKTIRRERRDAQAAVEIVALTGADLKEEHWDAFFRFYMDTGSRKWGSPYLNRRFYSCSASGWPTGCCWCWRGATARGSPAP